MGLLKKLLEQTTPSERYITDAERALEEFGSHIDAMLFSVNPKVVEIHSIEATPERAGWGTKAMRKLCELADAHKITLVLEVESDEDHWNDDDEDGEKEDFLIGWYSGFGFNAEYSLTSRVQMKRVPGGKSA